VQERLLRAGHLRMFYVSGGRPVLRRRAAPAWRRAGRRGQVLGRRFPEGERRTVIASPSA